jgi:hypothetical protein
MILHFFKFKIFAFILGFLFALLEAFVDFKRDPEKKSPAFVVAHGSGFKIVTVTICPCFWVCRRSLTRTKTDILSSMKLVLCAQI